MAIYKTKRYLEGVWVKGMQPGESGVWQDYGNLVIEIRNGEDVVPASVGAPSNGTQVRWSGPDGNGDITFYHEGRLFSGSCQDPGKEPRDYWGKLDGWYG